MALGYAATYDFSGVSDQHLPSGKVMDFIELLKPGVMTLVVFTAIAGMAVAPGSIHPFMAMVAILSITIGSGAAGAINMWYERDIDAIMTRTKKRPIPTGRVSPNEALAFGIVLTVLSIMLMGLALNWVAAGLLGFASFFYVVIYTMLLKRSTPQNIVIGGAAGAFPPLIGWAAVTGSVSIYPVILFAIIFFWTPPHFWALAIYKNPDYKKAGVPMMPAVAGIKSTKRQMLVYTLLLAPLCLVPFFTDDAGLIYLTGAVGLNALFIYHAIKVLKSESLKPAKSMFAYSIIYLFALFSCVMVDGVIGAM